jgi:hypothetical protein
MVNVKAQNSFKISPAEAAQFNRFAEFLINEGHKIESVKDLIMVLFEVSQIYYNQDEQKKIKELTAELEACKSSTANAIAGLEEQLEAAESKSIFTPEALELFNKYHQAYTSCDPEADQSKSLTDLLKGFVSIRNKSGLKPAVKGKVLPEFLNS